MDDTKKLPHFMQLTERSRLVVSGVREVGNFDEQTIRLFVNDFCLTVSGKDLKLERLSVETGDAEISGFVTGLQYTQALPKARGLLAKVLR